MANSTLQAFSKDQNQGDTCTFTSAVSDILKYVTPSMLSCIINGDGYWQIFSGKDYTGTPNVLKAGTYLTPADMGMLLAGALSARLEK